jgi:PadR family transcriptional regulator PadR
MARDPFVDGVPELVLLRLLARREMYGYELVSEIRRCSEGAFTFGEGCVYPILHRLVADGSLSVRKESVSGRLRRYYCLTAKGQRRLLKLEESWEKVATGVSVFGKEASNATA